MQASLKRNIAASLPEEAGLALAAAWPPDTELDVTDMMAARWAMEKNEPAGNGTGTLPKSPFQFRPLARPRRRQPSSATVQAGNILVTEEERALVRNPRPDGDCHRPGAAFEGEPGSGREARRRAVPFVTAVVDLA